jgi:hypothetical protein
MRTQKVLYRLNFFYLDKNISFLPRVYLFLLFCGFWLFLVAIKH